MLDLLADFHFLRPLWLFGIIPFVGLWLALRDADRLPPSWRSVIDPALLEHLVTNRRDDRGQRPLGWLLPLGVLGCVAMAGPTWQLVDHPEGPDRSALVIAMELSDSMDGRDVGPTRARRATYKLTDLLDLRGAGQTGLIAYAGTGHVVMPLTDDDRVIRPYLASLSPELMPVPGDSLAAAVPAIRDLVSSSDAPSTVLLVTDGVDPNGSEALTEVVQETGAALVVYAVGTSQGDRGTNVPPLNVSSLDRLARATDATVIDLGVGDGDLRRILRVLDRHRRAEASPDDAALWEDSGYYLVYPFALLVLFWFRRGWALRLPTAAALMLTTTGCAGHGFVDLWLTPDQQGQVYFDRGDFVEAANRFEDPMWKGISFYAAEDWGSAIDALAHVETAEGHYNLGNAYAQNRQWITAIQQYDAALALRPTFREARANRDLLQGMLDKMREADDPEENAQGVPPPSDEDAITLREDQKAPSDNEDLEQAMQVERDERNGPMSDETLELWMRRVDTKPGDFLSQKFATQAGQAQ
ncbi:MAG: VWA domain-containing protein [Myxococcota bacterium]